MAGAGVLLEETDGVVVSAAARSCTSRIPVLSTAAVELHLLERDDDGGRRLLGVRGGDGTGVVVLVVGARGRASPTPAPTTLATLAPPRHPPPWLRPLRCFLSLGRGSRRKRRCPPSWGSPSWRSPSRRRQSLDSPPRSPAPPPTRSSSPALPGPPELGQPASLACSAAHPLVRSGTPGKKRERGEGRRGVRMRKKREKGEG